MRFKILNADGEETYLQEGDVVYSQEAGDRSRGIYACRGKHALRFQVGEAPPELHIWSWPPGTSTAHSDQGAMANAEMIKLIACTAGFDADPILGREHHFRLVERPHIHEPPAACDHCGQRIYIT